MLAKSSKCQHSVVIQWSTVNVSIPYDALYKACYDSIPFSPVDLFPRFPHSPISFAKSSELKFWLTHAHVHIQQG